MNIICTRSRTTTEHNERWIKDYLEKNGVQSDDGEGQSLDWRYHAFLSNLLVAQSTCLYSYRGSFGWHEATITNKNILYFSKSSNYHWVQHDRKGDGRSQQDQRQLIE